MVEVVQSIGGVVIGVKHHHIWFVGYCIADTVIVGILSSDGIVCTSYGSETEIVTCGSLFHEG